MANDLVTALKNSYCFKQVSASEAKAGDIVVDKSSTGWVTHVMMVADTSQRYYYAHTYDICSGDIHPKKKVVATYSSSATILQFPEEKCKKCERDEIFA